MKLIHDTTLSTLIVLSLIGCNNPKQQITNNTQEVKDTITKVIITNKNQEKSIAIKDNCDNYPVDSLLTTKILTTGTFHNDEIEKDDNEKVWLGLFKTPEGYSIAKTKLNASRVYDAVLDENEYEKTAWNIKTAIEDTCIVLIEPLSFIKEKSIETITLNETLLPNHSKNFNFLGIDYKLTATGNTKKDSQILDYYIVSNYKLYLTASINGKDYTQLLVAKPSFDYQMIRILFAGDIDGDGKLDLLLDTSSHYNATSPTLYLSKPAIQGPIIRPMGKHTSVGC